MVYLEKSRKICVKTRRRPNYSRVGAWPRRERKEGHVNGMNPDPLPFKGRAGVGMGTCRQPAGTKYPIPLPASPLKGEE
jgi:hypothetical protein